MKTSKNGIQVMHYFESCKLEAYPDPGSVDGKPHTIGWGSTGKDIYLGLKWTQEQADNRFEKDLEAFERGVLSLVKVPLTQGQFDALVSFAYNVGLDIDLDNVAEGLGDSTLLKLLNNTDYQGASNQFLKWNKNDGKVMLGLTRRRVAEKALFDGKSAPEAIALAQSIKG
jgi:lysozyme